MTIQNEMEEKLKKYFNPTFLEVSNESHFHHVPEGSETHFRVVVVSNKFNEISLVKQHQMVNEVLKELLKNGVHALSIITRTPQSWEKNQATMPSPKCRDGYGK